MAEVFAQNHLTYAMELGQRMLQCGGEVSRVEDSISRICCAYGAVRVDVFSITSSIVVTAFDAKGQTFTQTRRVGALVYDLSKLCELNALSRRLCLARPARAQVKRALARIDALPRFSFRQSIAMYAMISAAFSIFFGGSVADAASSAAIGTVICFLQAGLKKLNVNALLSILACSMVGGLGAHVLAALSLAGSAANVSIGNVMLLIPGIALTNAIRDLFSGDTISALLRFAEALVGSIAIAWGFAVPAALF